MGVLRWGVTGTAVTTLLAQCLSAVLMLMALSRTRLPPAGFEMASALPAGNRGVFEAGLPAGIQSALYPIANILVQSSINQFGTESIAAWAVCGKLDFLIWLICDAMSATNATLVAQNIGAGQAARARQGVRIGTLSALLCVAGIGGVLTVGSVPLGSCFVDDEGVLSLVGQIMAWLAPLYVLYVPGGVLPGRHSRRGGYLAPHDGDVNGFLRRAGHLGAFRGADGSQPVFYPDMLSRVLGGDLAGVCGIVCLEAGDRKPRALALHARICGMVRSHTGSGQRRREPGVSRFCRRHPHAPALAGNLRMSCPASRLHGPPALPRFPGSRGRPPRRRGGRALAAVCPARPWQRRPGCLDGGIQHGKAGPDARHAIWGGMRSVAVCY